MFVCFYRGWASDIYGRRKLLLIGIIVSGIAILVFGLSKTYFQAVFARSISGIFNGNLGIAKAYTGEITNQNNRAFAFSIVSVAFSVGIILGSTFGGVLLVSYDIDDLDENGNYKESESILPFEPFYTMYPYLLPCLFGSILSVITSVFIIIFIQDLKEYRNILVSDIETNDKIKPKYKTSLTTIDEDGETLQQSLMGIESDANTTHSLHTLIKSTTKVKGETIPLATKETNDSNDEYDTLSKLVCNTPLKHCLVIVSSFMVFLIGWNAQAAIFLAQGLDLNSTEIGIFMAWTGIVLLSYTWLVQPYCFKRFSHRPFYIFNGIGMMFIIIGFPSLRWLPYETMNTGLLVGLASFVGGFKFVFSVSMYVLANVFTNNSVPSQYVGKAHGIAQSLQSLFRGLGPIITGGIWSYSMTLDYPFAKYYAYFVLLFCEVFAMIWLILFVNNDIQYSYEDRKQRLKIMDNNNDNISVESTEMIATKK